MKNEFVDLLYKMRYYLLIGAPALCIFIIILNFDWIIVEFGIFLNLLGFYLCLTHKENQK